MALAILKGGDEPKYYAEMGNGFYSGSDFVEMGVRAGLRASALRSRLSRLVKNIGVHASEIILSSFMQEDAKSQYEELFNQRIKFLAEH